MGGLGDEVISSMLYWLSYGSILSSLAPLQQLECLNPDPVPVPSQTNESVKHSGRNVVAFTGSRLCKLFT